MKNNKVCKGIGLAKGHGCAKEKIIHRYGLCTSCFGDFLYSTDIGKEILNKSIIRGVKRNKKQIKHDMAKKKRELKTTSKNFNIYKTTAWDYCKKYVLLYYADSNNIVKCSTSGLVYHVADKNMHAGHYIKYREGNSTNNSTAFLFENLAPQCARDNRKLGGKPDIMQKWLIEKHGEDKINNLTITKRQAYKLDKYTLFGIKEHYKKLFKDLLIKRGISDPWQ